ncbi:hypothetical protein BX616_009125 [Lobosporangium transversale]|uniref:Glutathione S-transferase n=1 Tax=Lobosporangium transversale TaxID=64571 RepID=A0A1Y2H517_9FUNG|nr:glutathione S-transferase [Lobosporangium transversale]KAF9914019.1 hypothetical protein BX616_009125 [Lobosporangium transversale]ORZ28132.1 glutathione S-transferase [Lobosporangium transversale]|eukprot:XP_021885817.1 glutathione S-transferase [Lobosporangium transversale]
MVVEAQNPSAETVSRLGRVKENKYQLLYFHIHGVVTGLRAMFAMSDADYTFTHPVDWKAEKPNTPLGAMPVLYETVPATGETVELAELSVIEFYIGSKYGWTGDNVWENNLIRMYHSSTQSMFDKLVTTVVRAPKENYDQMMEIWAGSILPEWVEYHERALKKNGSNGHYVGNKLTLADIKTATCIDNIITLTGDRHISREKTPAIMAVYDHLESLPKYAEWKASEQWKTYAENNKQYCNF